MSFNISGIVDLKIILASLSGSIVYILTQHHFERDRQPFIFLVSFVMGMIGADTTLVLVKDFIPCDSIGERSVGAFLCSSLVVTVIVKIIYYIETKKINMKRR